MFDNKDYIARLNKARRKRKRGFDPRYLVFALLAVLVIGLAGFAGRFIYKQVSSRPRNVKEQTETTDSAALTETALSEEEMAEQKEQEEIQAVIDSYGNLGIVNVDGYLNLRSEPDSSNAKNIIGKLQENSACEILEESGEWTKISSGGLEGYISSQYLITGDEAKEKARELVVLRAVITADSLNIREQPSTDENSKVVGQAIQNERYEVLGQQDGWIQIYSGYISADYAETKYCMNEARKLDLSAMALNQYDNLIVSKVTSYLNIRKEPSESGTIIGKMPSKAAGEILETLDGWYKIRSGSITGYVSADYTATGQEARDLAMGTAALMAIVNTDKLNVRTEPNLEAKRWTQISKEERYPVLQQLDGWVEIELDAGETEEGQEPDRAFISTRDNNVEVRYSLPEAIKFSPLEEANNAALSRRAKIVNYALQFVGNPYVWGGTSLTNGADCSGFTMKVMQNFGVSLPHYSGSQAKMGKAVKSSEMRPGDLIFYANSGGTINHVAMYIGNGQIVHAASRKSGIKISTWNYRTPKTIRNVLGD